VQVKGIGGVEPTERRGGDLLRLERSAFQNALGLNVHAVFPQ
jgi:hypothetical protein